ncbi:S8 family serine peptidase [Chungangia koreensis]|uniref:S8 family serine peptidase n=1 Tax=Chungangia koreensis TaxID=752657 RepID=A0ABV8X6R4_9LACT
MKLKRVLLLMTIFILSFSSAAIAATGPALTPKSGTSPLTLSKPDISLPERLANPENPEENVRIIVELTDAPTIEKATQQGVLYKELSRTERQNLERAVEGKQQNVKASIQKAAPTIKFKADFTTVFNGFSAEVKAGLVEKIANTPGVKAVYESTEYERPVEKPEMVYSKELVQAQQAWNEYGFKGEGMVVGVIDTGIDPDHKDMVLTDDASGEITSAEVEALLENGSIEDGKYYTAKVPFGYNYMDNNDIIRDIGPDASMHGMHVAGTVGANGNEENGGIKGVAPEAQLLALKVFGNDPLFPSTYGDIYIEAIDDAIKLGADVINMSLGSTAGFVDSKNPEQQAVKRAVNNGVLVAISAGNSALFGDGYFYPYAENQDYGLTGSPSVSYESFGVASFENSTLTAYSYKYAFDGADAGRALYLLANTADPSETFSGPVEIMAAGLGKPADFAGKDFNGKVALVQRGELPFTEKGLNAQAAGAVGIIIYNNAEGTVNMASDPAITIPYMFSLKADGDALKSALDAGQTVTVQFDGQFTNTANPLAGQMSAFTSWGPTPNLDFKPEITAPGGNIFSTLNDNKYGIMSGTSMAAPHVAGGTALVMERVDKEFKLKKSKRIQMAKNLMMNTAKPVEFAEGEYVSPRRQGAGLMQLANALNTNVVVTNKATGEAKVALKEITGNVATFTLEAENFSNRDATYNVDVAVQTDYPVDAGGVYITPQNQVGSLVVTEDVDIDAVNQITVPKKGKAVFDVSIDLGSLEGLRSFFTNGFFVDGFVTLTDPNEEITGNPQLTVPFFGFNGGWDDAPLFDYFAWNPMTYWGYTALADEQGSFITGGGAFDTNRFGFSPNNDGVRDQAVPVFSLMRNAKEFKVEVVDAKGNVVRTLRTAKELRKHYISAAGQPPYTYSPNYAWDGKINGKVAADGQYFIKLSGVIDFAGAEWQSISYPVKVDTKVPTAKVAYDSTTKTVKLSNVSDGDGTGIEYWQVLVNGEVVSGKLAADAIEYVITQEVPEKAKVEVAFADSASNYGVAKVGGEKNEPVIYINEPGFFSAYGTGEVLVEGRVEDESDIKSLTINGEEVDEFDGLNFSHVLTLTDGVKDVKVAATDIYDNFMEIRRIIFVDTAAPELTVENAPSNVKKETVKVKVNFKDNFDQMRLTVNGDEKFNQELSEPYTMKGFNKTITVELALVEGDNEFVFEVEDLVGHKTTQTIVIKREGKKGNNNVEPPVTAKPVTPQLPGKPITTDPVVPQLPGKPIITDPVVVPQLPGTPGVTPELPGKPVPVLPAPVKPVLTEI